MSATLREIVLTCALTGALACGSADSDGGTLSVEDVTGLPPGNAVGTSFSGTYVIQTSQLLACDCRVGSCSNVRASRGARFAVSHQDGVLGIVHENARPKEVVYSGGIDRDGKFRAGGTLVTETFTWLSLMQGTVVASVAIDGRTRVTLTGEVDGAALDCDGKIEYHAPYSPP